mmetsp:Transcript_47343/g.124966  ORF Transcript_47343/g.124966 Transcript_47343/m.124966 type:complete len:561 (-) Transcript_47343:14-1696(-)
MGCGSSVRKQSKVHSAVEQVKDLDFTGEADLVSLPPEKIRQLAEQVLHGSKTNLVDLFTKLFYLLVVVNVKSRKVNYKSVEDIGQPLPPKKLSYWHPDGIPCCRMPVDDEDWDPRLLEKVFGNIGLDALLALVKQLPNEDKPIWFDSLAEGAMTFQLEFASLMPTPHETFEELRSDEAMELIAFWGAGQAYLRGNEKGWEIDLNSLGDYPVRPGYEKYGARAYFNEHRKLQSIYCRYSEKEVRPDCDDWEHAKWVWRVSLGFSLTGGVHFAQIHWIASNCVHIACREHLGEEHPVRKVLKVFLFNTGGINYAALSKLYPEDSFLQRSLAFTYEGMVGFLRDAVEGFKYETHPQFIAARNLGSASQDLPLVADGLLVWDALHSFFEGYVGLFYEDDAAVESDHELVAYWDCIDSRGGASQTVRYGLPKLCRSALVDQLTHHAFVVTAWHEFVHGIAHYVSVPDGFGTKIRPGRNESDVQSFVQGLCLVGLTGMRMPPLLSDWRFLLPQEPPEARDLQVRLMEDLRRVSAEVEGRNASAPCPSRRRKVESFNPKHFECSVSM